MLKLKKKLISIVKFWIYWIVVVTLTISLFFALLENADFDSNDMEFYLTHKDNLRYNFRLIAIVSFILTYISGTPLINRLYKNKIISFRKRLLWQTSIYFLILIAITVFFILYNA